MFFMLRIYFKEKEYDEDTWSFNEYQRYLIIGYVLDKEIEPFQFGVDKCPDWFLSLPKHILMDYMKKENKGSYIGTNQNGALYVKKWDGYCCGHE